MSSPTELTPSRGPDPLAEIRTRLRADTDALLRHPVYARLTTLQELRTFAEHHCFAVWDFMSLLKALQQRLTCVRVPWTPSTSREGARLINEIVVAEESDLKADGRSVASHFELYLEAMEEIGADTATVRDFVERIATGTDWRIALENRAIPASVRRFVHRTLSLCTNGDTWAIAAEFVIGRENLIPDMFREITKTLTAAAGVTAPTLDYYLERHIELDGDEHGPAGAELLGRLCGKDATRWQEVESVARAAITARSALWDGVVEDVRDAARS